MAVKEIWNFHKKTSDIVSRMNLNVDDTTPDHNLIKLDTAVVIGAGTGNYPELNDLPTINGSPIIGDYLLGEGISIDDKVISLDEGITKRVRVASTAQWNVEPTYVPSYGQLIVYTDYMVIDGVKYAGFKVGDGSTYIVDLPFMTGELNRKINSHIADAQAHVSAEDRAYWNSKHRVSEVVEDEVLTITF